ncbi:MAG: cyclic pyranopterin monophosphate synthase MoaC [Thaumarchaeota archaeon]|nr:cyclic pyranopterin monophosphate synthase MoaC [Nitrososphaerota archaeon]MDA4136755.1 cyclic pyranopterin monophosphate synthase MoaC [Nitrososphaerota archaeon]
MKIEQADISGKPVSFREATARGSIKLKAETIKLVKDNKLEKGDVLSVAKTMAILAVKTTPEMIALCHPLKVERTRVEASILKDRIEVTVTVSAHEKTGVEMEALTAVAVALLNIWDMTKGYEKDAEGQYPGTRIEEIRVVKKVKRVEGS